MVGNGRFEDPPCHETSGPDGGYEDTIALLQEEIARLENELLARDEARVATADPSCGADPTTEAEAAQLRGEIQRLRADLAAREDTILLLMDQLRLVEEAELAARAEWEQLAGWLAEIEHRVERSDPESGGLASELQRLQARLDSLQSQLDQERRAWNLRKQEYEREIDRLTDNLARAAGSAPTADQNAAVFQAMEQENRLLREACRELREQQDELTASLRQRLQEAEAELAEARRQQTLAEDDRQRERKEFEVAIASLRAQTTRSQAVARESTTAPETSPRANDSLALEVDMRIRAFRQHLQEIHCHEAETRNQKRLASRLSRLWIRTAPR